MAKSTKNQLASRKANKPLLSKQENEYLLSKQAIQLPPKERLQLLLSAKRYPIVKKGTSAEAQIKEMLDFYKLCGLMLANYFPNEEAEAKYLALAVTEIKMEQQATNLPVSEKLSKAFDLVRDYEEFERKIRAIRSLFWEYSREFPELFDEYNLEDIASEKIMDMLENARYMIKCNPQKVEKILSRWEIT